MQQFINISDVIVHRKGAENAELQPPKSPFVKGDFWNFPLIKGDAAIIPLRKGGSRGLLCALSVTAVRGTVPFTTRREPSHTIPCQNLLKPLLHTPLFLVYE